MKWKIQLNGGAHALDELSNSLVDDELRIYEKDRLYFLESSRFENLTNSKEVTSLAADILQVLTGAVRFSGGGRIALHIHNITGVLPDGGPDVYITLSGQSCTVTQGNLGVEKSRADGTIEVTPPMDKMPGWVMLGLSDQNVAKALRLFGNEHNWGSLYCLYEVIEEDVGGLEKIISCGWATKTSIKLFKHTAWSPSAVGDASRHGKEPKDPPSNPMDIGEALALIEVILLYWLQSKI